MMRPLLLDANNLIRRSIAATAEADLHGGGFWTGGVYTSLTSLSNIAHMLGDGPVFAFFDAGVPSFRLELIPSYKAERAQRRERIPAEDMAKAYAQLDDVRGMLPLLGVPVIAVEDREADDCVAAAARVCVSRGMRPVVLSSDKDLYQTIRWGASVFDLARREEYDRSNWPFECPVDLFGLFRLLVGDTSDSVPGLKGCGEKTAEAWCAGYTGDTSGRIADQLAGLVEEVVARECRTRREEALLDSVQDLLRQAEGIDLSESFGDDDYMAELMHAGLARVRYRGNSFAKFCGEREFTSVLSAMATYSLPFRAFDKVRGQWVNRFA